MRQLTILITFLIVSNIIYAQTPTWSDDISQIIYNNCTECHRDGGIGPFPLTSYEDAQLHSAAIYSVMLTGEMPPWPPDNDFQEYAYPRNLPDADVEAIKMWATGGTPEGSRANTPCPPVFDPSSSIGTPDLTLQIPTYASKATNTQDDYVCFSIPTGLTQQRFIKSVEVIPGNHEIVHHVLVYVDDAGTFPTDTGGLCMGADGSGKLVYGYAPGSVPMEFPSGATNMGVSVSAGANIVLAMHYPEGSFGMLDSTKVNIVFYPTSTSNVREVIANPVIFDFGFCINANTTDDLTQTFPVPGVPGVTDISVIGVFPHMHLIGTSISSYAVSPSNDTIKTVNIPKWDFEWQDFYRFKNVLRVPGGSTIYGHASYDNTSNNPNNPNNPPQTICAGLNTSDEMFIVYYQYLLYQAGDENILLRIDTVTDPLYVLPQPTITQSGFDLTSSTGDNYQWFLNGTAVNGATSQMHTASASGDYYVEITDNNGCSKKSESVNIVGTSIDPLDDFNGDWLVLYPNPAQNIVNLKIYKRITDDLSLNIVDIRGKTVVSMTDLENDMSINLESLPRGVYFAELRGQNFRTVKKLIHQ